MSDPDTEGRGISWRTVGEWSLIIGNTIAMVSCSALVVTESQERVKVKHAKELAAIEAACPRGRSGHAD